ncbi:MAG TPA: RNA polymerase sigma factor [Candidatus Moranbacteria bacterium]|nr:RNA polymerase sigma factor [Candidatus Moranbacteria bacterium]
MAGKMKSQPQSLASRKRAKLFSAKQKKSFGFLNQERKCPSGRSCNSASQKGICCHELNDIELIRLMKKKDAAAYNTLSERYYKKLFSYIFHFVGNKDETEDILQNVFSKTFKNIRSFDVSRKFSSWVYRIAHNEAINFLKRRNKRILVSWDDISTTKDKLDTAFNEELPGEKWEHMEIVREIDKALEKLPPKYKQVLKLRYFQEYSYEEIGAMLGKPVNTIGTLINRAKKKLLEVAKNMKIEK